MQHTHDDIVHICTTYGYPFTLECLHCCEDEWLLAVLWHVNVYMNTYLRGALTHIMACMHMYMYNVHKVNIFSHVIKHECAHAWPTCISIAQLPFVRVLVCPPPMQNWGILSSRKVILVCCIIHVHVHVHTTCSIMPVLANFLLMQELVQLP